MKANPLLIAVVVLAVLGGAVYYSIENPPADEDAKPELVKAKEADITEVTVTKAGQAPITVVRGADDKWTFGGGLTIPADDSAIGLMITNLASMDADRVVEENVTDWAPYGLEGDGELSVDVKFKEAPEKKIIFGGQSPTGSNVFARVEGESKLYTAFSYVKSSFDKTVFDWRDKALLQADDAKVSRVRLDLGDRKYELGKTGEGNWQILEPGPVRGDNFSVGDLARAIEDAQMTAVVSENGDAPGVSFDKPYAKADVTDDKGEHTLTIARAGDLYYAKSSDQPGVYEISSTTAESLNKKLEDLRDKKLFDFGFAAISRVTVKADGKAATIAKKEDKWLLSSDGDREVDAAKVQTLIDSLRNLTAIGFPSDSASDHARYGLASPAIEAEVQEAEGDKKAEKVLVSDPSGARVYAARAGEATVYELEKAPAQEIVRALDDVLTVEPAKEEAPATEKAPSGAN
ncbi:MAG: DUF4340 domain-containing protein [Bryobacterales bacterium]